MKKRIEGILFVENRPVSIDRLKNYTGLSVGDIEKLIVQLNENYKKIDSCLEIIQMENTFQLILIREMTNDLSQFFSKKKFKKLTKAALETLAIIAYNQPITRAEVEKIRGVNSDQYLKQLVLDNFVESCGYKDAPGKPMQYRTTKRFLMHFELNALKDLPPLEDIKNYDFLND